MPRGDEYHQPNAPDSYDDEQDSDLELELQELGPRGTADHSFLDNSRRREDDGARTPVGSGRFRAMGRRAIRLGPAGDGHHDPLLDDGEGERPSSPDGLGGEDAAPLLPSSGSARDTPVQQPRLRSKLLSLLGIGRPGPRVYSLSESAAEAADDGNDAATRTVNMGEWPPPRFPSNAISNAKYTPWSFLPRTLYNEFSFFINLYFLVVALSQLIPDLRLGVLWTYMVPLAFVLTITLGKEAYDDIERRKRDAEANREPYTILRLRGPLSASATRSGRRGKASRSARGVDFERLEAIREEEEGVGLFSEVEEVQVKSKDIKVGDVLKLTKNDRVPADVVILKSSTGEAVIKIPMRDAGDEPRNSEDDLLGDTDTRADAAAVTPVAAVGGSEGADGETFIRTDQLDGETDWKLRLASPLAQNFHPAEFTRLTIVASKPSRKVNEFVGRLELAPTAAQYQDGEEPAPTGVALSIDNTAWQNTVLASNATVLAAVVYTGSQTRAALSTAPSRSKVGLLEYEINNLTKILCALTLALSSLLVLFQHLNGSLDNAWWVSVCRFLILFSTIIPISLRVNLDLGKTAYAYYIQHDKEIPDAIVRTSTIPEDLGRIEYLLSDKTGTLTQNEMDLRKVHVGTVSYANEAMDEVAAHVRQGFASSDADGEEPGLVTPKRLLKLSSASGGQRTRREVGSRVRDLVLALALCHNVTPTTEEVDGEAVTSYQASSPDEIAIVKWTESVGLRVIHRDRQSIALAAVDSGKVAVRVRILEVFPFTSESKRMGILLEFLEQAHNSASAPVGSGEIWFYQKGADTVMTEIVAANDWLDEETANMAREGLRTLVVGRRRLSPQQRADFAAAHHEASLALQDREARMAEAVREHLEHDLELLGVTGVEDRLQADVKPSLELLRNAGIKIWMLTGDKVETARCVAVSAKLVSRNQRIHVVTGLEAAARANANAVADELGRLGANPAGTALLVDGDSLGFLLRRHQAAFISLAVQLPAVIACRCSPTQKADVALLIRAHTGRRVACIGDGGNDVSMIQAADVGVGIVGKEGRQASLAADFSITQFRHLTKLLVWHGRNSYKRSAKLGQFVIHRGLAISVAQTVFSAATAFEPNALFPDWLLVGYSTAYTQLPAFSFVLDRDIDEPLATLYPELYKELAPGTSLSYRTFFKWLALAVYQGALVQVLAQLLVGRAADPDDPKAGDPQMVAVAFTALILNELGVVAMEVTIWHWLMALAIVVTAVIYAASVPFLGAYFDLDFVWSWGYVWRVVAITAIVLVPPYALKLIRRTVKPPSYRKVRGI